MQLATSMIFAKQLPLVKDAVVQASLMAECHWAIMSMLELRDCYM